MGCGASSSIPVQQPQPVPIQVPVIPPPPPPPVKNINIDDSDTQDLSGVALQTTVAPRTIQDRQQFLNSEDKVTSKLKSIDYSACFNKIKFEMFSSITTININSTQKLRKIKCGVRVNTEAALVKYPMDLICVLDDSGSMQEKKAQLLRSSLKHLISIMPEETRVCLIKFSTYSEILTPFLRNTILNKIQLCNEIDGIVGTYTTNTESGMENALWMIKNRQYQNPITSIFLLTDGVDNYTYMSARIKKLVLSYDIQDKFQIYTFGYGDEVDHDELEKVAKNHKGQYIHIKKLEAISEWFVLKFSESTGILGFDVKIELVKNVQFTAINYGRIPGVEELWKIGSNQESSIIMPYLEAGKDHTITFELCCDLNLLHSAKQLYGNGQSVAAFDGYFSFSSTGSSIKHKMNEKLFFSFKEMIGNEVEVDNSNKSFYNDLEISFQRALGGDIMKKISEIMKYQNPNYEEAKKMLDDFENEEKALSSSIRKNPKMRKLMEDIHDLTSKVENKEVIDIRECKEMSKAHLQIQSNVDYQEDFSKTQLENATKLENVIKVEEAKERNDAKQRLLSEQSNLALESSDTLQTQTSKSKKSLYYSSKKSKVELKKYTEFFGPGSKK